MTIAGRFAVALPSAFCCSCALLLLVAAVVIGVIVIVVLGERKRYCFCSCLTALKCSYMQLDAAWAALGGIMAALWQSCKARVCWLWRGRLRDW